MQKLKIFSEFRYIKYLKRYSKNCTTNVMAHPATPTTNLSISQKQESKPQWNRVFDLKYSKSNELTEIRVYKLRSANFFNKPLYKKVFKNQLKWFLEYEFSLFMYSHKYDRVWWKNDQ